MAHILDFNLHASKACRSAAQRTGAGSAEIVIFPGVRYERWDEGASPRGARRTKQRDRIELPE